MNPQIHHHIDQAELTARTGSVQAFENLVAAVRYLALEVGKLLENAEARAFQEATREPDRKVAALEKRTATLEANLQRAVELMSKRIDNSDDLFGTMVNAVAGIQAKARAQERAEEKQPSFVDAAHRMMGRGPKPAQDAWDTFLDEAKQGCAREGFTGVDAVAVWRLGMIVSAAFAELGGKVSVRTGSAQEVKP